MTDKEFSQVLEDPSFISDRARSKYIAKETGMKESCIQSRVSRFRRKVSALRLSPSLVASGSASLPPMFHVYCIECKDPLHFYVGQSYKIGQRLGKHINGKVEFTSKHGVSSIQIIAKASTREEALRIELLLYLRLKQFPITVGGNDYKERAGSMEEYIRRFGY